MDSCSHGAGGPENLGDSIRAVLGQCCGLARCGSESAQKVQRVFEALELLFTETVVDILVPEEADPVLQEREDDGRTAKVVAFLSRRGGSTGPSDEEDC